MFDHLSAWQTFLTYFFSALVFTILFFGGLAIARENKTRRRYRVFGGMLVATSLLFAMLALAALFVLFTKVFWWATVCFVAIIVLFWRFCR
jgi:hypothetical protein